MTNNAINGIIINNIITSDSPFRLVWQETQLVVCSSHLLLSLCGFSPGFCGLRVGHMPRNKTSEDINIYLICCFLCVDFPLDSRAKSWSQA